MRKPSINILNVELILDVGSSNERRGSVVKRSWGIDGEAV